MLWCSARMGVEGSRGEGRMRDGWGDAKVLGVCLFYCYGSWGYVF